MKKKFGLIMALIAILAVVFTGCWDDLHSSASTGGGSAWDTAVGMTTGIGVEGSADIADGIIDLTGSTSALFKVAAPGATATSTITIKYICQVQTGNPDVTLKNGGWNTNLLTANGGDCNWYPTLTKDAVATLVVKGAWYTNPATDIWFQRNDYEKNPKDAWKIKIIEVTVAGGGGGGGGGPTTVWQPTITASTALDANNEYIGNFGIQRGAPTSELTIASIADGFSATVVSESYKQINIQAGPNGGTGSTDYYNSQGFKATVDTVYTITFMASVTSGTGQLRLGPNGNLSGSPQSEALTTTPKAVTCTWTQTGGNFKLDTGNSAVATVIKITGIKITTP